ncbi:MAG: hypothetical protein MJ186_03355 [Clostridia bacterium]|nr:hypothetical protein [Clostridia bacterium]
MKKFIAALCAMLLIASMTACGSTSGESAQDEPETNTAEEADLSEGLGDLMLSGESQTISFDLYLKDSDTGIWGNSVPEGYQLVSAVIKNKTGHQVLIQENLKTPLDADSRGVCIITGRDPVDPEMGDSIFVLNENGEWAERINLDFTFDANSRIESIELGDIYQMEDGIIFGSNSGSGDDETSESFNITLLDDANALVVLTRVDRRMSDLGSGYYYTCHLDVTNRSGRELRTNTGDTLAAGESMTVQTGFDAAAEDMGGWIDGWQNDDIYIDFSMVDMNHKITEGKGSAESSYYEKVVSLEAIVNFVSKDFRTGTFLNAE